MPLFNRYPGYHPSHLDVKKGFVPPYPITPPEEDVNFARGLLHHIHQIDPRERIGLMDFCYYYIPYELQDIYNFWYQEQMNEEKQIKFIIYGALMNPSFRRFLKTIFIRVGLINKLINPRREDLVKMKIHKTIPNTYWVWYGYHFTGISHETNGYQRNVEGTLIEDGVIERFEQSFGNTCKIRRVKFINNNYIPWICCSPDGIIVDSNETSKIKMLLEIKLDVSSRSLKDLWRKIYYRKKHRDGTSELCLRKNTDSYCQIQFSLFLTNLDMCLLIVHLPNWHSGLTDLHIKVTFDKDYLYSQFARINTIFLNDILPWITSRAKHAVINRIPPL